MRSTTIISVASAALVLLSACSSPSKVAETPVAPVAVKATPAATPRPVEAVAATVDPLNDPKNILSKRSIYFDFDQYTVKPAYADQVQAHAKYISANRSKKVLIQGNTDERGGSEYNLALGQKRAEAVRKAMVLLGTPDAQLEAVSFGKEKPKAAGHDEASWAENRRADIVYMAK